MHLSDRITGSFLVGLGAISAYGGSLLPPVPGQQVGPNVFPMVVGVGLCICGAMVAMGVGRHYEAEAEADLAAHSAPEALEQPQSRWWELRVLIPPALLVFYVVVADTLGFILTAATIVVVIAKTLGASWRLTIPVAILAPIGVHLIFAKLLRVPLPAGLLPMPW